MASTFENITIGFGTVLSGVVITVVLVLFGMGLFALTKGFPWVAVTAVGIGVVLLAVLGLFYGVGRLVRRRRSEQV